MASAFPEIGHLDQPDLADRLAEFVAHTLPSDVPAEVLEYGKVLVLDTFSCMVGGTTIEPRHSMIRSAADRTAGRGEATVVGSGQGSSTVGAAMVNAEAGAAMSAQDSFFFSHTANLSLAVAMAVAESRRASGADLLLAFVLGFEVTSVCDLLVPSRLPVLDVDVRETSAGMRRPFMTVGAAAAAARSLGLEADVTAHALSIAASSAPGDAGVHERLSSMNYYSYHDKARAGMTAAELASQGFTGHPRLLLDQLTPSPRVDGEVGVDRQELIGDLGRHWWILDTCVKANPTCRYLSTAVELVQGMVHEQALDPDDIERIVVRLSPTAASLPMIAGARATSLIRDDPATPLNAVFDIGYQLALVSYRVPSGPLWFTADRLGDARLRTFAERVFLEVDRDLAEHLRAEVLQDRHHRMAATGAGSVDVTVGGVTTTLRRDGVRGDPWSAQTRADLEMAAEKMRRYAHGVLPTAQVEEVVRLVADLESLPELTSLMAALRP